MKRLKGHILTPQGFVERTLTAARARPAVPPLLS